MNELSGAVALAQARKLEGMLQVLREKKRQLKGYIEEANISGLSFRKINDVDGECATMLTVIFDTKEMAKKVSEQLGNMPLSESGWHVYSNMEQIIEHKTPTKNWSAQGKFTHVGDLPKTDDILSRCVNVSVGVVDGGLGSAFGINIHSSDDDIKKVASRFIEVCKSI